MNSNKHTTGLALGGGGAKGFATFAIVENLLESGVTIDAVSGTSAGAIIGAYFALFGEVESLRRELEGFGKMDWLKFADFTIGTKASLVKGERYREFLEGKFGDARFEDAKIPLFVAVTDLVAGKVEYVNEGKIIDAILASSAYPGVFPPVQDGEKVLVDGGVLDNLPYEILLERGFDRVIAVNLSVAGGDKSELNSSIAIVARSLELMMDNAFDRLYEEDERLFVFDLEFESRFMSMWNVANLSKSYDFGKSAFDERKESLLAWYGV